MKRIWIILLILPSLKSFACSCECEGDCSFSAISNNQEFVALIKVIEYSDFIEENFDGFVDKMPYSMTVEIIEKYKGSESRKRIKIWGDNGALCRPYISNFEIGKYYLIAPSLINESSDFGNKNDYDFFACWTDFLPVDIENGIAYGKYSKRKNKVTLKEFESVIKE